MHLNIRMPRSRIVDDGKSNIFTYCINAGVLNLAGGVLNSI